MTSSIRSAKAAYWQSIFDQFQQTGQTVQAFCAEKGLSVPSFYQWRRKLRGGDATAASGIVPVKFLPAPPGARAEAVQIITPNGFVVCANSSMTAEALAQLLRTIASPTERGDAC